MRDIETVTDTPLVSFTSRTADPASSCDLEQAVEYVLDECFFTVGQVVGTRKTLDFEAVVWWRDHYRATFLRAMGRFGNQWQKDRHLVTAVSMLMAERAVHYAGDSPSIGAEHARRAAEDAARYCELHSRRQTRRGRQQAGDDAAPLLAGYWCVPERRS